MAACKQSHRNGRWIKLVRERCPETAEKMLVSQDQIHTRDHSKNLIVQMITFQCLKKILSTV